MKRIIALALTALMTLSLVACGGSGSTNSSSESNDTQTSTPATTPTADVDPVFADGPSVNLVFCHGSSIDTPVDRWANEFKNNIESVSGGKITVDIYPANQMGSERELTEGVQVGTYDIYSTSPISTLNFIPALKALNVPYMFTGYSADQIDKALNEGEFAELMEAEYEKNGFVLLGGFMQGATYRNITSNRKIETMDDFKGLKIRVTENPLMLQFWTNVGASPTAITFNELFMSLQQGVVDAQENPFDISCLANFQEVQDYLVISNHILHINHQFMNKDKFYSMPEAYQEAVQKASADARELVTQEMIELIESYRQQMISDGMTEIVLSDDVVAQMTEAAAPVGEVVKEEVGAELYNALVAGLEG